MRYELFGITPKIGQWRWRKERNLKAISNYQRLLKKLGCKNAETKQSDIDQWWKRDARGVGEENWIYLG